MAHYGSKGMASDLSLGRPTSCCGDTSGAAISARQHSYYDRQQLADDAEDGSSAVARLECHVRALQRERDKLHVFRKELPICLSLLDDAIEESREQLTKALTSSGMVACQVSYSNVHMSTGGVPTTPPRDVQLGGRRYSSGSAFISTVHAHASDHNELVEKQQPQAPTTPLHYSIIAHPLPSHGATPSRHHPLHLLNYVHSPTSTSPNMFLNKLHQNEATLFNQESAEAQMMGQPIKIEGFHQHEFSNFYSQDQAHIMTHKEAKEHEVLYEENVHGEDEASPRVMIPNMPNNNINSSRSIINQTSRKARRCWSPELHQLFLHALHQLGGPQLATPKQIRELMRVEGLTNDEVKSHLQKFRLHTRRPAPIATSEPTQQPHHLVLFGGIWVPRSSAESLPAAQLGGGGGHVASSGQLDI